MFITEIIHIVEQCVDTVKLQLNSNFIWIENGSRYLIKKPQSLHFSFASGYLTLAFWKLSARYNSGSEVSITEFVVYSMYLLYSVLKVFSRRFQPGLWNLREPLFEALVGRGTAIKCQPRFCKILSFYTEYFYFFCLKTMIFEHFPKRGRVGCKFDNNCSPNVPKLDQIVTN